MPPSPNDHEDNRPTSERADPRQTLADRLLEIGAQCAALPDFDPRHPDDIIGYGETGLWS